jgi:hypothetical protein
MPIRLSGKAVLHAPADWRESELDPQVEAAIKAGRARMAKKIERIPDGDRTKKQAATLAHFLGQIERESELALLTRDERYRIWLDARLARRPTVHAANDPAVIRAIERAHRHTPSRADLNEEARLEALGASLAFDPEEPDDDFVPAGEATTLFAEPAVMSRRQPRARLTIGQPYPELFGPPDDPNDD